MPPRGVRGRSRSLRRWPKRCEEHGYEDLYDRRKGRPGPKRIPYARGREKLLPNTTCEIVERTQAARQWKVKSGFWASLSLSLGCHESRRVPAVHQSCRLRRTGGIAGKETIRLGARPKNELSLAFQVVRFY